MSISLFELFSVGIGPSSSHTVGPMQAAADFVAGLEAKKLLKKVDRIQVEIYGSLALTGGGHGTDKAILNGLEGKKPDTVDAETLVPRMEKIVQDKTILLGNQHAIPFDYDRDYQSHQKIFLEKHSNGMKLSAYEKEQCIKSEIYYSIGGGFIVTEANFGLEEKETVALPLPFCSAADLLRLCEKEKCNIADIMLQNESVFQNIASIKKGILNIADVMTKCIERGLNTEGILPGGLFVKRRAAELYQKLETQSGLGSVYEKTDVMNWLNAYAMAVNEENAAGHQIVTAPTNGAAGIIPAVMRYYQKFVPDYNESGLIDYFLTAAAIGILYKKNASISGAEVGCQGEVGVASSMAAAGLTAAMNGTPQQVENAAEIAMEHHLGMTCDPIAGLVQIPCIERNAMGAVKAVNAARMALITDGEHYVSLDKVIDTMRRTGEDMMSIYKETSLGGLAVNIIEC